MTWDLWSLAAMALLQFGLLTLHGTYIAIVPGLAWGTGRRDQPAVQGDLGRRLDRSIANTVEGMAVFVPLVLILHLAQAWTPFAS